MTNSRLQASPHMLQAERETAGEKKMLDARTNVRYLQVQGPKDMDRGEIPLANMIYLFSFNVMRSSWLSLSLRSLQHLQQRLVRVCV
jgi:hypothetical protein